MRPEEVSAEPADDTAGTGIALRCRGCASASLVSVLDFGLQPNAATFPTREELATPEPRWPLRAWICASCWLMQLDDAGPEEETATTASHLSRSETISRHVEGFAADVLTRLMEVGAVGPGLTPRILEVASHGGYLQEAFRAIGTPTKIVEGSASRADEAEGRGLAVERIALVSASAQRLMKRLGGPADAVVDFYLLAHLREPGALLSGIQRVLRSGGFAVVEFDHLLPIIQQRQFDAVRHGHFSYFSLLSFGAALTRAGLQVFDVQEQPVYGGALRAWVQDVGHARHDVSPAVDEMLAKERHAGLDRVETYRGYHAAVERTQRRLCDFLERARRDGQMVAGYGAPSRGTTLLNSCGITTELLPFVVDRSPAKQGRFLPGSRIPIRQPADLLRARPDFVLVLTWDLTQEVVAMLPEVRSWGGQFVVPIPELSVLP